MWRGLILIGILGRSAWAGPTGLTQIPTADLVPYHQLNAVLQNGNTDIRGDDSLVHEPEPEPQAEAGLPWNAEGGLDLAPEDGPEDYRPIVNVKWRALDEGYRWPAVALGAEQLGVGFEPTTFLVVTRTLNYQQVQYQKFRAHHRNIKLRGFRVHAGTMETSNVWRGFVGTDLELSDHFVFYGDWISGARNSVSLGGVLVIDRANSITAAALRANDSDRVTGVVVMLTHTFDW